MDWTCPVCRFDRNFETNHTCYKCQAPNPNPPKNRKGRGRGKGAFDEAGVQPAIYLSDIPRSWSDDMARSFMLERSVKELAGIRMLPQKVESTTQCAIVRFKSQQAAEFAINTLNGVPVSNDDGTTKFIGARTAHAPARAPGERQRLAMLARQKAAEKEKRKQEREAEEQQRKQEKMQRKWEKHMRKAQKEMMKQHALMYQAYMGHSVPAGVSAKRSGRLKPPSSSSSSGSSSGSSGSSSESSSESSDRDKKKRRKKDRSRSRSRRKSRETSAPSTPGAGPSAPPAAHFVPPAGAEAGEMYNPTEEAPSGVPAGHGLMVD